MIFIKIRNEIYLGLCERSSRNACTPSFFKFCRKRKCEKCSLSIDKNYSYGIDSQVAFQNKSGTSLILMNEENQLT